MQQWYTLHVHVKYWDPLYMLNNAICCIFIWNNGIRCMSYTYETMVYVACSCEAMAYVACTYETMVYAVCKCVTMVCTVCITLYLCIHRRVLNWHRHKTIESNAIDLMNIIYKRRTTGTGKIIHTKKRNKQNNYFCWHFWVILRFRVAQLHITYPLAIINITVLIPISFIKVSMSGSK